MSHNSAGRLPYDSIVPRASLLARWSRRTGWLLGSCSPRLLFQAKGSSPWPVFTRVGTAGKELVLLVQTTLHYRTGYHGLHACVGRLEGGALFLLFHAQNVCTWSGHVGVVPTLFCNALTCYTLAFSPMDISLASLDRREGRCGDVEKGCGARSGSVRWIWLAGEPKKRTKIGWEVRLGDTFRFFFLEAKFCNNALLLWEEKKEDFQTNSIGELLDCSSTWTRLHLNHPWKWWILPILITRLSVLSQFPFLLGEGRLLKRPPRC